MNIKFDWELFLIKNSLLQKELAQKLNTNKDHLGSYVRAGHISIKMKQRIEKALGVNLNEYLILGDRYE